MLLLLWRLNWLYCKCDSFTMHQLPRAPACMVQTMSLRQPVHCETITLISSSHNIFNFNHNILCTWPHAQLYLHALSEIIDGAIHNQPNLHSLVFQMYLLVVQALHGYTRFWLQFLNNSYNYHNTSYKSYMTATNTTPVTFGIDLPQIEKLMLHLGATLSSLAVMYS